MKYKPLTNVSLLIVHCSATPASMDVGVKEIDRWHRAEGWFSIGYHRVIRRNGVIENGRTLDMPGAHARGYNEKSLGVCLVGGVDIAGPEGKAENNFTPEQFASLRTVLLEWKALWPDAQIIGHRDVDKHKECPSFDVKAWLAASPLEIVTVTASRN